MTRISFERYAEHDPRQSVEWIDGALEELPPLSVAQVTVQENLLTLLGEYVEENHMGLVVPGPFAVRMPEEMRRGREPDLLFLPNFFDEAMQETYVNSHGVGLVVEIANEATRARDSVDKFADYQMAGIPEFWLLDVDRRTAEFYVLQPDARYHAVPPDAAGVYHSTAVKGFSIQVNSIWD
jgi:Uma2 family endonuclease